jgi:hypothetical protein
MRLSSRGGAWLASGWEETAAAPDTSLGCACAAEVAASAFAPLPLPACLLPAAAPVAALQQPQS